MQCHIHGVNLHFLNRKYPGVYPVLTIKIHFEHMVRNDFTKWQIVEINLVYTGFRSELNG